MNRIRAIQALNKAELENGVSPSASWHADYRDTAFVYFGGLPFELSEGDVLTIFSQYGEPVFLKLARDPETGKSRGFGWLKYEDQRSTDLAVDNLCGATVGGAGGRMLTVDHARYKPREDEDLEAGKVGWEAPLGNAARGEGDDEGAEDPMDVDRPMLEEERKLLKLIEEHDEEDPMKAFLIEEAKAEVEKAKQRGGSERKDSGDKDRRDRHKSHRSHRHHHHRHRDEDGDGHPHGSSRRHREDDSDSRRDRKDADRRDVSGDDRDRRRHRSSERKSAHRDRRDRDDEEAVHSGHRRHGDDKEDDRRHGDRTRHKDRDGGNEQNSRRRGHDSRSPRSRPRERHAGNRNRSRSR